MSRVHNNIGMGNAQDTSRALTAVNGRRILLMKKTTIWEAL